MMYFWNQRSLILENLDHIFEGKADMVRTDDQNSLKTLDHSIFIFSASFSFQRRISSALNGQIDTSILSIINTATASSFKVSNISAQLKLKFSLQHGLIEDSSTASIVEFIDSLPPEEHLVKTWNDLDDKWIPTAEKIIYEKLAKLYRSCNNKTSQPNYTAPSTGNDFGSDPIAIVGMACRFPGANDLAEFWSILESGLDTLSIPNEFRFIKQPWILEPSDPSREAQAGYLSTPIDEFDARFFGINSKEVEYIDPQSRILHEVLWESLENSGINPLTLKDSRTGIFTGSWSNDYERVVENNENYDHFRKYMGNSIGAMAARLAVLIGATGPCVATESGCSSTMMALHLAVRSLQNRECNLAVAGGVNLIVKPYKNDLMRYIISTKCRTFDEGANGYARAEGCGLLVLKRLSEAIHSRDNIWAIIRGTGVSQEGLTKSMGTPTVDGEALAMKLALEDANVNPEDISYVEAHGTGTRVGDPLEVAAITNAYFSRKRTTPLVIGSVKTNVGHTESCSGITGIIKTVLALHHKIIPRHLNLNKLNPDIDLSQLPAVIPLQNLPWPESKNGGGRMAGVGSFGISGTNCHVILQEAPKIDATSVLLNMERPLHIIKITGKTEKAVTELHEHFKRTFQSLGNNCDHKRFPDAAFTANTGRADFLYREIIIAEGYLDAAKKLESKDYLMGQGDKTSKGKVCFLFPGQGAQYTGMAKTLYGTSPVFRGTFDRCEKILQRRYGLSLCPVVWPSDTVSTSTGDQHLLRRTLYSQTAIFCVEFCLLKLWESWGVKPGVVVGHSLGEFAAAVAAGILDLEGALRLVVERSRFIDSLPPGKMLVIQENSAWVKQLLGESQLPVDVAAVNSPAQTVVAGEEVDIWKLKRRCNDAGVPAKVLASSHPFHSRYMDPILEKWSHVVHSVEGNKVTDNLGVQFISGMEGHLVDKSHVTPDYWVRQTRNPVQFTKAGETLRKMGVTHCLEIGPQPILSSFLSFVNEGTSTLTCLPSLRRGSDDWRTMLTSLGKLYLLGYSIDWMGFDAPYKRQKVPVLPTYPFDRQPYWMAGSASTDKKNYAEVHPFLGRVISNASTQRIFQKDNLCLASVLSLQDHRVGNRIIFPGAVFMEMSTAAVHLQLIGLSSKTLAAQKHIISLENFQFHRPLELREEDGVRLQIVMGAPDTNGATPVKVFSQTQTNTKVDDPEWILHASSFYKPPDTRSNGVPTGIVERLQERLLSPEISPQLFYDNAAAIGIHFGESFQEITKFWSLGKHEVVAEVKIPEETEHHHLLHPILIDAVFQASLACHGKQVHNVLFQVPVKVKRFTMFPQGQHSQQLTISTLLVYVWIPENEDTFNGYLLTKDYSPLVFMEGIELVRSTISHFQSALDDPKKELPDTWEEIWTEIKGPGKEPTTIVPDIYTGRSWLIFVPKRWERWLPVLNTLSQSAPVTALFAEETTTAICRGVAKQVTCASLPINDYTAAVKNVLDTNPSQVVFAWGEDIVSPGSMELSLIFLQIVKYLLGEIAPPALYVVTAGVYSVPPGKPTYNPEASVLHGMSKTLKNEHPNQFIRCVDLEYRQSASPAEVDRDSYHLLSELDLNMSTREEDSPPLQVAYREGSRYAPKFVKWDALSKLNKLSLPPDCSHYQLVLPSGRSISQLQFAPLYTDGEIADDQVEVKVYTYGLNFKDVLTITKPSEEFENWHKVGLDFAGVITKVGSRLAPSQKFKVGDRVFGVNSQETQLASTLKVKSEYISPIPELMTFSEAATLPVVFCTAYHCLITVAGMKKKDTVLIHAGSGGVGLAAIQLCQHAGSKVVATAGSPRKRAYLKSLGVKHVFESRNLSYGADIRAVTEGKGVDIVLNSLTGPGFKETTLGVCGRNARFVEISKRAVWQTAAVKELRPDVDYSIVDLSNMSPETCQFWVSKLPQFLDEGVIKPLPFVRFDALDIRQALEYFQKAKHIGKVVCTLPEVSCPTDTPSNRVGSTLFNDQSVYLITGGLGALGWKVGQWMLNNGATDLVLMGRRPPPPSIAGAIESLKQKDVSVTVILGNVAEWPSCKRAFEEISQLRKPLRGIIHCAGVMKDGLYQNQNEVTFRNVLAPKVVGTWNLHKLSEGMQLEHFVLFSSISAMFGTAGQANYTAANSFLDAFAHYRNSLGLPATSINWGLWAEVGMAKETNIPGLQRVTVKRMLRGLEGALRVPKTQICLADFPSFSEYSVVAPIVKGYVDASLWAQENAESPSNSPRHQETVDQLWNSLGKLTDKKAQLAVIEQVVSQLIQNSVGSSTQEGVDVTVPLADLGIDSLLLLELRNRMQQLIGRKVMLPTTVFNSRETVQSLGKIIHKIILTEESVSPSGQEVFDPPRHNKTKSDLHNETLVS